MEISLTMKIIIVFVAILFIVSAAILINLHNRCDFTSDDQVAQGEFIFAIIILIVGLITLIAVPLYTFYKHRHSTKTL